MSEEQSTSTSKGPEGATSSHTLHTADGTGLDYIARADWLSIRRREKTIAEMFHVAYVAAGEPDDLSDSGESATRERPVTFVFNGGPGAASAYLHMGAIGPKRVVFNEDGTPPAPPVQIVDNSESWLAFTDLVFIDPIGTGFSRASEPDSGEDKGGSDSQSASIAAGVIGGSGASGASGSGQAPVFGGSGSGASGVFGGSGASGSGAEKSNGETQPEREFYGFKRDLESLGEFIRSFLSKHKRWQSPVFIAGESYGGFRVGKLARMLQEQYGVGLNGAYLISPALELQSLDSSDYDVLPWVDTLPTFSLAAAAHGRRDAVRRSSAATHDRSTSAGHGGALTEEQIREIRDGAERFAVRELTPLLVLGSSLEERERSRVLSRLARFTGLSPAFTKRKAGRIDIRGFARELLADERRVAGLYDASVAITDPYPDRDRYDGPDATLMAIDRVFSGGINTQLRSHIGLDTERDYHLLSFDVNRQWKVDFDRHALQSQIGATDDLRYALQLNPYMHVRISHGIYDLVTPYFASERIVANMKLDAETRKRVSLRHYAGGHMFYTWKRSREAFARDAREFYRKATGG